MSDTIIQCFSIFNLGLKVKMVKREEKEEYIIETPVKQLLAKN